MRLLVCFFFCILVPISCFGKNTEQLEQRIRAIMGECEAVGLSVVVVKDNKICYTQTFGYNPDYNDTTKRNPIPEDGVYWIASISKSFIKVAILQLKEKGLLSLDDDVNMHLGFKVRHPKYPNTPITVNMLLSHMSSLNDKKYGWNYEEFVDTLHKKLYSECYNSNKPGKHYEYRNLNYCLLGLIIENISGLRLYEYVEKYITAPLGMNASYNMCVFDSSQWVRTYAYDNKKKRYKKEKTIYNKQYYEEKLREYKLGYSAASLSPAGGMRASALDLTTWMLTHMNQGKYNGVRILGEEEERLLHLKTIDSQYEYGFSKYDGIIKGKTLLGMRGGSHGIKSAIFFDVKDKYGFVIICNGSVPKTNRQSITTYAARVLYDYFIEE